MGADHSLPFSSEIPSIHDEESWRRGAKWACYLAHPGVGSNMPDTLTINRMIGAGLQAVVLIACVALILGSVGAWAQDWPNRPVKVIVPYGPGGITDTIARLFGDRLTKAYGQPFVIENRGGARRTMDIRFILLAVRRLRYCRRCKSYHSIRQKI